VLTLHYIFVSFSTTYYSCNADTNHMPGDNNLCVDTAFHQYVLQQKNRIRKIVALINEFL